MTERALEPRARSPPPEEGRPARPSTTTGGEGERAFNRLLALLTAHLGSRPTSPVSLLPPALLFSVCDALRHARFDRPTEQSDPSVVLPSVLSKLREWRLLEPDYRHSPEGVRKLALDLAGVAHEASASAGADLRPARLWMRWVGQDREPSSTPPPPSPSRSSIHDLVQECAHVHPDRSERRSDAGRESRQPRRLGTPDSDDASAAASRRRPSTSAFRSGCSACRRPRASSHPSSDPPSPRAPSSERGAPLSDVGQFDRTATKKTRRRKPSYAQPVPRHAPVDENLPPLPTPARRAPGISFPRRTSTPSAHRDLSPALLPVRVPLDRRVEPGQPLNRVRHVRGRSALSASASTSTGTPVDPSSIPPSSIDPHLRAQSFSCTSTSRGIGSVAVRAPKRPSKVTTVKLACSSSSSSMSREAGYPRRPSSTSIPPTIPDRPPPFPFSRTHKHVHSASSLPTPPYFHARKWQA